MRAFSPEAFINYNLKIKPHGVLHQKKFIVLALGNNAK